MASRAALGLAFPRSRRVDTAHLIRFKLRARVDHGSAEAVRRVNRIDALKASKTLYAMSATICPMGHPLEEPQQL